MLGDRLHTCELLRGARLPRVAPPVPDLIPEERPWTGSAHAELERWRRRALAAEAALREARAQVAEQVRRHRGPR